MSTMMSVVSSPSSSTMTGSSDFGQLSLQHLIDYPPGTRPVYSYHALIRGAILGSPTQCRTATEITEDIENKFPYFKTERGKPCRYYMLNALSNTPCFLPTGSGPIQDELYWIYRPTLDADRTSSILSPTSSPTSPSISTLVNLQPLKEEGDTWIEIDLAQTSEKEQEKEHSTLRKKCDRQAKKAIRIEREVRTEEWTRQMHGVGKLHKSLPIQEVQDEEIPKQASRSNSSGKILKPNRPRPQPEDFAPVPPKPSTKLKKAEGKNEEACCVIS